MDKYKITATTWNKVARLYEEKFMYLNLYDDTYDCLCDLLKPNAEVLDVGCGPGNITKYILSKRTDVNVLGVDVSENMVALARNNCTDASFEVMDIRDIKRLENKFDCVVAGFCLLYLVKEDLELFISSSVQLLNASGYLYISVVEGDYSRSGFETGSTGDGTYVYYYDTTCLLKLLNNNGFELISKFKKNYTSSAGISSTHLILIAKKQ